MAYVGVTPVPSAVERVSHGTLASDSATINVDGGYQPGYIHVYLNGALLAPNLYTAEDGTTVDFGETLPAGTDWLVQSVRTFAPVDAYTQAEADAKFPVFNDVWTRDQADNRFVKSSGIVDFTYMPWVYGTAMLESGSNNDGYWWREASGVQVCWNPVFYLFYEGTTALRADYAYFAMAYPSSNVNSIVVEPTAMCNDPVDSYQIEAWVRYLQRDQCRIMVRKAQVDGSFNIGFIAYGRWK